MWVHWYLFLGYIFPSVIAKLETAELPLMKALLNPVPHLSIDYILHFVGPESEHFHVSTLRQVVFIKEPQNQSIAYLQMIPKHANTIDLIISHCFESVLSSDYKYHSKLTSIYLLTCNHYNKSDPQIKQFLVQPPLKFIITVNSSHTYQLICPSCGSSPKIFSYSQLPLIFSRPYKAHKQFFTDLNLRFVAAPDSSLFTKNFHQGIYLDEYSCINFLSERSPFIYRCSETLISTLYAAKAHNFTLILHYPRTRVRKEDDKLAAAGYEQHISQLTFDIDPPAPKIAVHMSSAQSLFKLQSIKFNSATTKSPLYCKKLKTDSANFVPNYLVWVAGVQHDTWVFITAFLLLIAIIFVFLVGRTSLSLLKSFLSIAMMFVGESPSPWLRKYRFYIFIVFVGMHTCWLYENSILSSVSVWMPTKTFESLQEAVADNYKILYFEREALEEDKRLFPLLASRESSSLEDIVHFERNLTRTVINIAGHLANKMIFIFTEEINKKLMYLNMLRYAIKMNVDSALDVTECYIIPETVFGEQWYWKVQSASSPWILETFTRLTEAGLDRKWSDWISWNKNLALKLNMTERVGEIPKISDEDKVDMSKLLAICSIWLTCSVAAGIVLILENLREYTFKCNFEYYSFTQRSKYFVRKKLIQRSYLIMKFFQWHCSKSIVKVISDIGSINASYKGCFKECWNSCWRISSLCRSIYASFNSERTLKHPSSSDGR